MITASVPPIEARSLKVETGVVDPPPGAAEDAGAGGLD